MLTRFSNTVDVTFLFTYLSMYLCLRPQMLRFFATHFASTLQPRFLDMARGVRALTAVSDSTRMRLYEALVTLSNGTMNNKNQACSIALPTACLACLPAACVVPTSIQTTLRQGT